MPIATPAAPVEPLPFAPAPSFVVTEPIHEESLQSSPTSDAQPPTDQAIDLSAAENPVSTHRSAGVLEMILFALGLAAVMVGQIFINKPKVLFDGPLELDECLTHWIVSDPNISHSVDAVRHGVDTNPPVYHLILRLVWMAVHPLAPDASASIVLRAFSMACVWLALVGVYNLLRGGFTWRPSLLGVLAVWAHPVVVEQSANARFYGPLLLATVLVALSLALRGNSILRGVIVALAAIFLCTLHYFGILMLGSLVLAMWIVDDAPFLARFLRTLPTLAGVIAVAAFYTFIREQAQGLTVRTWVDPFTFRTARDFAGDVLCPLALILVAVTWSLGRLAWKDGTPLRATAERPRRWLAAGPMLMLILVPAIIIAFSATVQSALIPRYAIAAALIMAPITALMIENRSGLLPLLLALVLSGFTVLELHSVSASRAGNQKLIDDQSAELAADTMPMVFADRADAARLQHAHPDLLPRLFIADERAPGIDLTNFRTYELEMTEKVSPFYPSVPLQTAEQLTTLGRFHLIAANPDLANILLALPLHRVSGDVYEVISSSPIKAIESIVPTTGP